MTLVRRNYGSGHTYHIDGAKVPGVTTLIKKGFPAPGLINWTGSVVAEFVANADDFDLAVLRSLGPGPMAAALRALPFEQRSQAAVRGTRVHKLADQLARADPFDPGTDVAVPADLIGHVDSCTAFLDQWRVTPLLTEASVGNRWVPYGGTLDLVADVPGVGRVLIDWKTGDSGVWPETVLQLGAYRWADFYTGTDGTEVPMSEIGIDATWAVWVRADGYDVIPIDTGSTRDGSLAFQTFRAAAYIATRAEAIEAMRGDALPPPRRA